MGTDGHIASLFPKTPALQSRASVLHTTTTVYAVRERLSLGFQPIMGSRHLLLLLRNKQDAWKKLSEGSYTINEFPAKKILDHPSLTVHHLET